MVLVRRGKRVNCQLRLCRYLANMRKYRFRLFPNQSMSKPLFSEFEKLYLARFLGGDVSHPTTAFEARAFLERAAAVMDLTDPDEAIAHAGFQVWADDLDPPSGLERATVN
jgi:hypothetical protein